MLMQELLDIAKEESPELSEKSVRHTLVTRFGGVVKAGCHSVKEKCGCIRELRSAEIPASRWTDCPDHQSDTRGGSPTDRVCQLLNDLNWTSDELRTERCFPLVFLTEKRAVVGWRKKLRKVLYAEFGDVLVHEFGLLVPTIKVETLVELTKECLRSPDWALTTIQSAIHATYPGIRPPLALLTFVKSAEKNDVYKAVKAFTSDASGQILIGSTENDIRFTRILELFIKCHAGKIA
jgi:hypothetical protein